MASLSVFSASSVYLAAMTLYPLVLEMKKLLGHTLAWIDKAESHATAKGYEAGTLLQTFKRIDSFECRREGALQAYLRQALMNGVRYELRRTGRRAPPAAIDSKISDDGPSPLEQAIGQQATERYEQALARLRPEDREAIIARVEMGYSYERLAEALEKPSPEAARKAARRALLRLALEMKRAE